MTGPRGTRGPGRWLVVAGLVLGGTAAASERDLKEARIDVDKAIESGDAPALAKAAARLAHAEPPRGALELVGELGHRERRVALAARDELARSGDPRVARALGERLASLRETRPRRLLAEALGTVPGDEVSRALVRALDDREASVRAAAATALGARGPATAAIVSGVLRARALHDPSLRVQRAAATAGERLGSPAPPGFDVGPASLGMPSRFFAQHVAFVIDASSEAREASFLEPPSLSPIAPVPSAALAALGTNARTKMPVAKLVSAFEVASQAVASALVRLGGEQAFSVLVFNERSVSFSARAVRATARETSEARDWLLASPLAASDERDSMRALERALEPADAPPDEVWLAITGPPAGRATERSKAAIEALADRAWARDVPISVILLETEPAAPPRDEREKVDRARAASERRGFADAIAGPTGGRVLIVPLLRPVPDAPAAIGSTKHAEARRALVPLSVAGRVSARDLAALKKRVEDELKSSDEEKLAPLAAELAAAPDEGAVELALRILEEGPVEAQLGALDGFARNKSAKIHEILGRELHARTDGPRALLLVRTLAAAPGPDATRLLAVEALRRDGPQDLVRVLATSLAERPSDELAPIATELAILQRRARSGLAGFEARRALALAHGLVPEARPKVPEDGLLPAKSWASGVAFLVDTEAAMDARFELAATATDTKAADSRTANDRGKTVPHSTSPRLPATRRAVVAREVAAALDALAAEKASANIIPIAEGGHAWRSRAAPLAKGGLADARAFLEDLTPTPDRQILRPLERALEDPEVEEVWILVAGEPVRSDADRNVAAVHRRVRGLALRRCVRVNVVLVLGAPAEDARAQAARRDELARLESFYRPITAATGGVLVAREHVRPEKPPSTPLRHGGIAGVSSPTRR